MKLVIRLLTAEKTLLGWATVTGEMRGDGNVYATRAEIVVETPGVLCAYNVQWPDLGINLTMPYPPSLVERGQVWSLRFVEPVFMFGRSEDALPAVTERANVEITVPTGALSVRTH